MNSPSQPLHTLLTTTTLDRATVAARTQHIAATVLKKSAHLLKPNFNTIHPSDLALLFAAYDEAFFAGGIRAALRDQPLSFYVSDRMTSAGGKTICRRNRLTGEAKYEIGISLPNLWGSFLADDHRTIEVNGHTCHHRLDALQRIMEHEIMHLTEMLVWRTTSCSKTRFQTLAYRWFAHTEHTHQLITPRESAQVKFGVKPGVRVQFRFDGKQFTGTVARVSKRATVLVADPAGERYTDGNRYRKYYVPVAQLAVLE